MIDVSGPLASLGAPLALLLVMVILFAESGLLVGFFLPGDSLLFTAGVLLAAGALRLPLVAVVAGAALAAFAGDQLGYLVGRRVGPRVFRSEHSRLFSRSHVDRAHAFFLRHGPRAVILARFVPVVRTFTPTIAGVGAMPYRRFVVYNAIGATAWPAVMLTAGHVLGGVPLVAAHVDVVTLGVVALSLVPALAAVVRGRRSRLAQSASAGRQVVDD